MEPTLSQTAMIFGAALALFGGGMLCGPQRSLRILRAFHRNRAAGMALSAVDLVWAGWLLHQTPLPWLNEYKGWLLALVPLAWILSVWLMDEHLAPRALGGLFLLAPTPMLTAARMAPSAWSLAVVVAAYIMAIKGIILMLSPYRFRLAVQAWLKDARVCRVCGLVQASVGLFFVLLGATVF